MPYKARIIRGEHSPDKPYTVITNEISENRSLSWEARGVLLYVIGKPDHWKVMVEDLKQGCGRDKVHGILRELKQAGYVSAYRLKNDLNQFVGVRYVVHEEPRPALPDTAIQNPENQFLERGDILDIRDTERTEVEIKEEDLKPLIADAIDGAAPPPVDELAAILNIQEFQAAGSSGWPPAYSRRWLAASPSPTSRAGDSFRP